MPAPELPDHLTGALVVAVDDSAPAREALAWAVELAAGLGRPLAVINVWNLVTSPRPEGHVGPPSEAAWQADAEQRLAALVAQQPADGVELRQVVAHGNTTPVLLDVSRRAEHLVVGSRGRGGVAGLLLGSTSNELVHRAECPVTVVRHASTAEPGAASG